MNNLTLPRTWASPCSSRSARDSLREPWALALPSIAFATGRIIIAPRQWKLLPAIRRIGPRKVRRGSTDRPHSLHGGRAMASNSYDRSPLACAERGRVCLLPASLLLHGGRRHPRSQKSTSNAPPSRAKCGRAKYGRPATTASTSSPSKTARRSACAARRCSSAVKTEPS